MFFELLHKDKKTNARAGIIHTAHGNIETPCFMPVGTQASVKTLDQQDLENLGAQIILGNTYHLHLRPNENLIAKLGGLHKFMNWNKPILTDSGGFQVFSLGLQKEKNKNGQPLVKIDNEGVTFKSHVDGSAHRFTPESAIEIQHKLGADIIMAFDECTPDKVSLDYAKQALDRTHDWAERSLNCFKKLLPASYSLHPKQYLFGIIQGSNYKKLRQESAKFICSLDFDGVAIGGESIGYNMAETQKILDWVYQYLPENKPHYAMGLGLNPTDLFTVVERGIDMFDCVAPTRLARHGIIFIKDKKNNHRLNITNAKFAVDTKPIDKKCSCQTCQNYTRAYLHHLFKVQEMTAMRLATIHNIHFFLDLMKKMREAIRKDKFLQLKKEWF